MRWDYRVSTNAITIVEAGNCAYSSLFIAEPDDDSNVVETENHHVIFETAILKEMFYNKMFWFCCVAVISK